MIANRFDDAPRMDRPNRDLPTVAATVAVVPGLVLMVLGANRLGLIHLIPVVAAILPFAATDWKSAGIRDLTRVADRVYCVNTAMHCPGPCTPVTTVCPMSADLLGAE